MQLLGNVYGPKDAYYLEDDQLENMLKEAYKHILEENKI